jgi:hypothetical protein
MIIIGIALAADELKWVSPLVLSAFMTDTLCKPHSAGSPSDFPSEEAKYLGVTALGALNLACDISEVSSLIQKLLGERL